MKNKNRVFLAVDIFYLTLAILPFVVGIVLKVLTSPVSEGINVTGAIIYSTIKFPFQDILITESTINSALVIISILGICLFITHGIQKHPNTRRQLIAEWIVEKCEHLTKENMGEIFVGFAPFIAGILSLSAISSLLSLLGLYPPTSDINIVGGWAILVFILITYYKFKAGPVQYLKSFAEPVAFLTPLNVISEIATPISMAFRHYGNILSGVVISILISTGLTGLTNMVLGWLPGFLGDIPLLRIGLPAVLSLYFDLFSGCLQAFIFAMLTMLYISGAFPLDEYEKRKLKKQQKSKSAK